MPPTQKRARGPCQCCATVGHNKLRHFPFNNKRITIFRDSVFKPDKVLRLLLISLPAPAVRCLREHLASVAVVAWSLHRTTVNKGGWRHQPRCAPTCTTPEGVDWRPYRYLARRPSGRVVRAGYVSTPMTCRGRGWLIRRAFTNLSLYTLHLKKNNYVTVRQ